MSVLWLAATCLLYFVTRCSAASTEECIQQDKNTREISKIMFCEEGCCGNPLTYAFCCELLNPDKMYTQYDHKKGLSPIHYFLIGLGCVVLIALMVALVFCIIKYCRTDRRTCAWV